MNNKRLSEIIIKKFGENLFRKSLDFPKNKIKIISLNQKPLKLRSIILDNDREFHLIIDENKLEIFHDCPIFLFNPDRDDKICNHIIKILTLLDEQIAITLLEHLDNYYLTLEDYGSKKKSTNFLKLANQCLEDENCVDGLNYLNKAIINTQESETIIKQYLETALKNHLYIEFFEFLQNSYENEFNHFLSKFTELIENGTRNFFRAISLYSFFEILRIINSIDTFITQYNFQNPQFFSFLIKSLFNFVTSDNLNEKYFSFYFIAKYNENMLKIEPKLETLLKSREFKRFKSDIVEYFLDEIENFCALEKIKLMKKQIGVFKLPETRYISAYKAYKQEIKELERKAYLRKFSFLKLFMEKFKIKKTKIGFRKKRNTYIVNHNEENINNPAYKYIIKHIGFYGLNDSTIKSSEIGVNYLIITQLFLDDLTPFPDIFYYKKQFWGDSNNYEINSHDFYSIISKNFDYNYEIDQNYSENNDLILIEWDLASTPRQGSLVNAFGAQIIIPDQNNPLFHDLNPFDLCYCQKTPVKIERNLIKAVNVITKCSFKDAIKSISNDIEFIEGYYPLWLVKAVITKNIDPFEANRILIQYEDKLFIPDYNEFVKAFQEFLFDFINKERECLYDKFKFKPKERINQLIILLNLNNELAGLTLPLEDIINRLYLRSLSFYEFRAQLLTEIHKYIEKLLENKQLGCTNIFNLKKMRNTPFMKYSKQILQIRREEFENCAIYKIESEEGVNFDISEIKKTYYGKKFLKILSISDKPVIRQEHLNKMVKYASELNLVLKLI